jgi:tRNA-specific 2-thiouridylase
MSRDLRANRLNWISIPELTEPIRVSIKVRHRHTPAMATLSPAGDGEVSALFDQPQRAITPGQSAVFYQEDEVVGGGWII